MLCPQCGLDDLVECVGWPVVGVECRTQFADGQWCGFFASDEEIEEFYLPDLGVWKDVS